MHINDEFKYLIIYQNAMEVFPNLFTESALNEQREKYSQNHCAIHRLRTYTHYWCTW